MKPTVGRIVLFTPNPGAIPLVTYAAVIAHVHSDTMVNLAVFDSNGNSHARTSVELVAPGAPCPEFGFYCQWQPHQAKESEQRVNLSVSVDQKTLDALQRIIQKIDEKIQEELV